MARDLAGKGELPVCGLFSCLGFFFVFGAI
jgi:hypothetical protein